MDFSDADWQSSIDQNLLSAIRFSRLVAPIMKRNQWGRILSVSSTVAKEPSSNMVLSATLRAGLGAFTKSIASELAPHGITANVLCPGGVLTDRLKDLVRTRSKREGVSYDSLIEQSLCSIPSGRFADPDELGKAAAFLCSDDSAYITGVSLGGWRFNKGFYMTSCFKPDIFSLPKPKWHSVDSETAQKVLKITSAMGLVIGDTLPEQVIGQEINSNNYRLKLADGKVVVLKASATQASSSYRGYIGTFC